MGNPLPFRVKICGVTSVADARTVASSGADAIGLNFYPPSSRYLNLARAVEISAAIPDSVRKVGLFVNATLVEIQAAHQRVGFDWIQLHGDEPPELIAELAPLPVLRAFRLAPDRVVEIEKYLAECTRLQALPAMILLDAFVKNSKGGDSYGGTGQVADWSLAASVRDNVPPLPLVLAGGLTAENVADAVRRVRPDAVDTASGVESAPGQKDGHLVSTFVARAQAALKSAHLT